jgi:ABC-type nitrate/sulfonate/bicarbonate transport system substrate-binding protein
MLEAANAVLLLTRFVSVYFIAAILTCLVAAPVVGAERLRISYASVTGNTAVITYVAHRAGLFEKYGLDTEIILITGGPASISALLNGDVDLDLRAPIAAIQAISHGAKLTFLLSQSNTLEYDVVTRPEIRDVKQLRGKKIGIIRFGGISELMVRYLFQKLGLDADKDIAIVQVGQARFSSLERGAIEATVLSSAESAYAKRAGFRVLDMPTLPFFGSTVVTTPTLATKKSDAFTRYMKGYLDGMRFFFHDRERSSQYIGDLLRTKDRDMIELAYKTNPQHQMGRKPYPDMAAVRATLDIMGNRDPLVKKLKAEDLFNLSYLTKLDQSGFIEQLYQGK